MVKYLSYLLLSLFIVSCNRSNTKTPTATLKGELVFLLQYHNKLPSDVGFITNHIVERRLANLLKNDFSDFLAAAKTETPIEVSRQTNCLRALFVTDTISKNISAEVIVDVSRDAFWVEYTKEGVLKKWADYPELAKPIFEETH